MSAAERVLVGDVGGTHARFGIVDTSATPATVDHRLELDADEFKTFDDALRAYLDQAGVEQPKAAAIAVAGPVTAGKVNFTNRGWQASEQGLKALGFAHALLINDFAALAFSAGTLESSDLLTIGPELPGMDSEPITILGAGTGFGVSCLARYRGRAIPVATEGGHMSFAPRGEQQMEVVRVLARRFEHVSIERVLSGPGLENLHAALVEIVGEKPEPLAAAEITAQAEAGEGTARKALDMFCSIYGAVAGDFALAHGARGGVLLAGGIAEKIEAYLERSAFRASFEDKGRLSYFVKPIPTRLIRNTDAAFLGAARASVEFRDS